MPASSGGQRAVFYLDQYLGKRVALICVSTNGNDTSGLKEPLQFQLLPKLGSGLKRYINPGHFFSLKKIIKDNKTDVLIIEHPYMGWLGWLLKATLGVPLVIRSHNIEAIRFKALGKWWWRILADYERWVHKKASHSFFITPEDRDYAIKTYGLVHENTTVITYGLEMNNLLTVEQKKQLVKEFKFNHQIAPDKTILLFNGIFGYPPNDAALTLLIEEIYPALLKLDKNFHLIICGGNIPEKYKNKKTQHLSVLGFVADIKNVFQATEIFLNPIWLGGGIKTKLIEALASGSAAVSFESGAIGIPKSLIEDKLLIVADQDIQAFTSSIMAARELINRPVPHGFLEYFDWEKIADKALNSLRSL